MRFFLSASCFLATIAVSAVALAIEPPLPMDQAFRMEAGRDGSDIAIRWQLEDGYYLYREYLSVTGVGGKPLEMATPPGVIKEDPGYGSTEVYYGTATATVAGPVTGSLNVTYQGCQDGGLCYPPTTVEIDAATLEPKSDTGKSGLQTALRSQAAFPLVSKGPKAADSSSIRISDPSTNGVVSSLLDRGGVLFLIVGFLGLGVLLAFTPCVFPMYPILAATLTREGESLSTGRGFALSSTYVLALAAAFSLFGVVAAWWGQSFQIALQSPAATLIVAAIFVALALSSFGLFELQLPSFLRNRLTARRGSGGSLASSAALGFSSALVIGPCVTAPLAGALLYIAQTGDVVLGATALFALGVGKGIPLILMGTFGSGLLPRAGQWMERVRQVFGFLFFATAVWLVDRLLPAGTGLLLWSVLAITFAVFIGAFDQMRPEVGGAARLAKSAGILVGLYGVILGIGGLSGATDPLKPLATIAAASSGDATPARVIGKDSFQSIASAADLSSLLRADGPAAPTLVYFTADWCVTCRVIERSVLPDATVADALDGIRLVSVDLSEITEANQSLMKELQVVGPPTMLFLDRDNQEVQDTRLVGEITAGHRYGLGVEREGAAPMNAVSLGPFAFDAERFAAIIGMVAFVAVASVLAHRVDDRLGRWSSWTAVVALAAARLGHVLQHAWSFAPEPWRILSVWQGGFSWSGGAAGVAVMLVVLFLRSRKLVGWAAASVAAGAVATTATLAFTYSDTQLPAVTSTFRTLDGAESRIGDNGRPTVLNLWATWCPPCRRELPMMAELAASTADVDFVFANQGEPSAKIADYLRSENLNLAQALLDPQLLLSRHYSAVGLPATLFLAADGTLAGSHLGEISREVLAQKIQELKSEEGISE